MISPPLVRVHAAKAVAPVETCCDDAVGLRWIPIPPEVILLAVRWYLRYGLS